VATELRPKPFEDMAFKASFFQDFLQNKISVFKQHEILGLSYQSDITNSETTITNYIDDRDTYVTTTDSTYFNVKNHGAKGDGTTDDTDAIIVTMMLAASGGTVFFPPGVYRVNPHNFYFDPTDGVRYCFGLLYDNMKFLGTPYSIIKLADAVSTDAVPLNIAIFAYSGHQTNIAFEDLTFDFNYYLNPINGGLVAADKKFHAAIAFCGESARGDDISFHNCRFQNSAGGNVILTSCATTSTSYVMGKRWTIRDCKFWNNGMDTTDFSAIFGWCDELTVDNCHFWQDAMPAVTKVINACEIHGSNSSFINNKIENYTQMLWVAPNYTGAVENVLVQGNTGDPLSHYGVRFYRNETNGGVAEPQVNQPIRHVKIDHNNFVFTDTAAAIGVAVTSQLTLTDIDVTWNTIRKAGTAFDSWGVRLLCQLEHNYLAEDQIHDNIAIEHNYIEGMFRGIEAYYDTGGGIGKRIRIRDNRIKNCRMAVGTAIGILIWTGLASGMIIDDAEISENSITSDGLNAMGGIDAAGTFNVLRIDGNHFKDLSEWNIYLADIVAQTTKEGDQNP